MKTKTEEYVFNPTTDNGIIDYTGVHPNKIFLANRKTILSQDYPSYLPPIRIHREYNYDIPAYKVGDNEYLLKDASDYNENNPKVYRASLDVFAALINYHMEFDRACFSAIAKRNEEARLDAIDRGETKYLAIRNYDIPDFANKFDVNTLVGTKPSLDLDSKNKPLRVSLKSSTARRMPWAVYHGIKELAALCGENISRRDIFRIHRTCLDEVNQKILDMELQKADLESTFSKGRETSYGDSNLDLTLLGSYGVKVKRQNGDVITTREINEIVDSLDLVNSVYGDVSHLSRDFGLKISHAGAMKQHASRAIGKFYPYYKAIGISFHNGQDRGNLTACHEYAHFLDYLSGKKLEAWYGSDIPGSIENTTAATFRKYMQKEKISGDYWYRTNECFARALQEYAHIKLLENDPRKLSDEEKNEILSTPGFVPYSTFLDKVYPLVEQVIDTYHERFSLKPIRQKPVIDKKHEPQPKKAFSFEHSLPNFDANYTQLELFETAADYSSQEHLFFSQIDQYLEKNIHPKGNIFTLQSTPDILQYSGLSSTPIIIRVGILKNAIIQHSLTNEEIRTALRALADPVFVFSTDKEKSEAKRDSVLILTDSFTSSHNPVSIALELNKEINGRFYHEIRSIHQRELIARNGAYVLDDWFEKGLLKYIDDKKISDMQRRERVYFPMSFALSDKENINRDPSFVNKLHEDVKTKSMYITHIISERPETYINEGDAALTREHIRSAKAAMRTYTEPVLKGPKNGLWKAFRDFKKHGVFDIQGAHIETTANGQITQEGWKQLYQAASIYRDKRFETFRLLFVTSDGIINNQLALSASLPDRVCVDALKEDLREDIIGLAKKTNTKIALVHNHPSGNISPSDGDTFVTENIYDNYRDLLLGHIILDHDSFSLWSPESGWSSIEYLKDAPDPLMKSRNPEFTTIRITGNDALAKAARAINESEQWNSRDWIPIIFTNSDSKISGIQYYSKEWIEQSPSRTLKEEFRSIGSQTGALRAFPLLNNEFSHDENLKARIIDHFHNRCFTAYYFAGEMPSDAEVVKYNSLIYEDLSEALLEVNSTFPLSSFTKDIHKKKEFVAEPYDKNLSKSNFVKESFIKSSQKYYSFYNKNANKEATMEGLEVNGLPNENEKKKPYYQLNAEMLLESIKAEKAPFLVKNVETPTVTLIPQAIRSASTGRTFRGMNQILAQISLKEMGCKDTEIITYKQAKKFGSGIKKGSKGLHLTSYDAEGKKQTVYKYYPYSATYDRDNLPKLPERRLKPNTVLFAINADPEKYLGKYLAATSLGAKFVTTPETMATFRKRIIDDLENAFSENRHSRIFELGNNASKICKETMSEIGRQNHAMSKLNDPRRNTAINSTEAYNPVTGEKFLGENAKKAAYLMKKRQSKDPRFLEVSDVLKAGLSLKKTAKEVLAVSDKGKTRFFYNAVDIEGMPPMNNVQDRVQKQFAVNQKQTDLDISM